MSAEERDALIAAVVAIPDHRADGYEWEWSCCYRYGSEFPDCAKDHPEHQHELISRERVLALLTWEHPWQASREWSEMAADNVTP